MGFIDDESTQATAAVQFLELSSELVAFGHLLRGTEDEAYSSVGISNLIPALSMLGAANTTHEADSGTRNKGIHLIHLVHNQGLQWRNDQTNLALRTSSLDQSGKLICQA